MFLKSLFVQNYRAVKQATISFEDTTLLIGENEVGKSSLLHVLKKVLNSDKKEKALTFKPHHFHYMGDDMSYSGAIWIKIIFQEQLVGEWSESKFKPIASLLQDVERELRELILEIKVKPPADKEVAVGDLTIYIEGSSLRSKDSEIFLWLQKMKPVINLSAGMLTGHGVDHLPSFQPIPKKFDAPDEIRNAILEIEHASKLLIKGHSINNRKTIEQGFLAAQTFINHYSRENQKQKKPQLAKKIVNILGRKESAENTNLGTLLENQEGTSKKLGVLLLIAALLRTPLLQTDYEIDPIWIIEDPEAHLHLMTISSVVLLIDVIRWQKIVTTYSSEILGKVSLSKIRRLTRKDGIILEQKVSKSALNGDDLRKISYHLRAYNNEAFFARVWLLVEGESEYWIMPQVAQYLGYNFSLEGIHCIVFAQSGLAPLVKVANELGIEWHILVDGDDAGQGYMKTAKKFLQYGDVMSHITLLKDRDIEHCFWNNGYSDFYIEQARLRKRHDQKLKPLWTIKRAVKNHSKPFLSLKIMEKVFEENSPGIPPKLIELVNNCISLARKV